MTPQDLRQRRKALGLTQAEFASRIGVSRDYVGQMERGVAPIAPGTATLASALKPPPEVIGARSNDPMEQLIYDALVDAGFRFAADHGGHTDHRLDFQLLDHGVAIEVKRMHSPRVAEQMARVDNVIVAQGPVAVRFLAQAIRSGEFLSLLDAARAA